MRLFGVTFTRWVLLACQLACVCGVLAGGEYQQRWSLFLGSQQDHSGQYFGSAALVLQEDGSIYIAGPMRGETTFSRSTQQPDSVLARFSSDGELVWMQTVAGPGVDTTIACELDREGNVVIAGFCWDGIYGLIGGNQPDEPRSGGFVMKYSPDGRLLWSRFVLDWGLGDLTLDEQNNIYVIAGGDSETQHGLLIKFDPLGNVLFTKEYQSGWNGTWSLMYSESGMLFVGVSNDSPTGIGLRALEMDALGEIVNSQAIFGTPLPPDRDAVLASYAQSVGERLRGFRPLNSAMTMVVAPLGSTVWQVASNTRGDLAVTSRPEGTENGVYLTLYRPVTPEIRATVEAGQVILRWDKELGTRLQRATSVDAPTWLSVKNIKEENGRLVYTNAPNGSAAFFRLGK